MNWTKRCIMGCSSENGHPIHRFPRNPKRRAEWFRILGITSRLKSVSLCRAHIPPHYIFGKALSKFALPYPRGRKPEPSLKTSHNVSLYDETQFYTVEPTLLQVPEVNFKADIFNEATLRQVPEVNFKADIVDEPTLHQVPEVNFKADIVDEPTSPQNQTPEPAVFELCNPDNGNPILNGCYFENDEFIMTSYTSTGKLTHKEQVSILNEKYEKQLKCLERLRKENRSLVKAVRRQEISFSELRKIKARNGTLRKRIKKFKEKSRKLSEHLKKESRM